MRYFINNRNVLKSTMLGLCLAASVALTGCSANFGANSGIVTPISGGATAGVTVGGTVHGGQQPVNGSTVQLWTVGTSGYGSTASPLGASVMTNSGGGFTLGSYTCPSNSYAYITAAGGDPQTGTGSTVNPAIALVAALGPCSSLTSTTFININEVTTVAAMWALAPFASVTQGTALSTTTTTPSFTIGTTSTNLQGLANAMGVASNLASVATGTSPGTNTNLTNVEYWQVNTLADILALCVNTTGVAGANCSPVITATTPSGGGTAPADTLQIALYLAQHPTVGTSLLSQVSSTAPFQPYDTSVNDWTIGYSASTGTSNTRWIAFDQFGNAWVTTSGAALYELSPTGTIIGSPITSSSASTIGTSYEVAVDTANNAWVTDQGKSTIFEVSGSTSAGGANGGVTGNPAVLTTTASTGLLEGITIDGSNNVWASISSGTSINGYLVGLLNGSYTTLVTGGALTSSPFMIAADMSNRSTFGNSTISGGGSFVYGVDSGGCSGLITANNAAKTGGSIGMFFTTAATVNSTAYAAGASTPLSFLVDAACNNNANIPNNASYATPRNFMASPYGIAFDNNNAMWVVNQYYTSTTDATSGNYSLSKMTPQNYGAYGATNFAAKNSTVQAGMSFISIPGSTGGLNVPYYLAMDGASAAWVANSAGNGLSAFTNTGTNISPATGFAGGTCSVTNCGGSASSVRKYSAARGIAVDGSGNIWVANTSGTYVTVVVGAATPTVTPLSLGIKNGTLASKP